MDFGLMVNMVGSRVKIGKQDTSINRQIRYQFRQIDRIQVQLGSQTTIVNIGRQNTIVQIGRQNTIVQIGRLNTIVQIGRLNTIEQIGRLNFQNR